MKRKTVLKTIGVIAAGAALVGGGTFAAWSDFAEIDGAAGAGVLQLTVSNTSSGSTSMGFGNMAPGEFKIQELYVASNDAESVPKSDEHTSELQSLMRISYAVFCLQKKTYSYTT